MLSPILPRNTLQIVQRNPRTHLPHEVLPEQHPWSWSTALPLRFLQIQHMPLYRSVSSAYCSGVRLYCFPTYVSLRRSWDPLRTFLWHVAHLGPGWGSFREELPQSLHARTVAEGLETVGNVFFTVLLDFLTTQFYPSFAFFTSRRTSSKLRSFGG
jgi:hypothetical protein